MDDRDQKILDLYQNGTVLAQIAQLLDIPLKVAKSCLRRALLKRSMPHAH